jgi:hypothetical protein
MATATWTVEMRDGRHTVVFEHGSVTGRRVIRVDGREVSRKGD